MENLYTIAIDASTKSTGIAIFKNKELISHKCITQSSKDVLKRIKGMTDEIQKTYTTLLNINFNKLISESITAITETPNTYKVQIIMEQIIPDNLNDVKWSKNQNTFKALFYLQAAIVLMFNNYNQEVEFIGASSWRKQCGIKQGGATRDILKARDIQFVKDNYNISVNDDVADAICIGHAKVNTIPEPEPFNWG